MCETDVRGQMGIADVPVGWQRIVVDVCIASTAPEADVRRVVETADRLSPLLGEPVARDRARPPPAHRSPARRPDMDARVFRRVQRYGWDAATNAYDRGWVPLLEGLTESCVARAGLRAGRARARSGDRHRRGRVRGGARRSAPAAPSRASTCPRRWSRSRAGAPANAGVRERRLPSATTWRRPAPPTARSTRSPARSA